MNNDPVKAVKAALTENLHIDIRQHPVRVTLENSCLVVEGTVESIAVKKRALLIAMGADGVEGVADRLRVKPSARMTDDEIKDHIADAIGSEPALKDAKLSFEVKDGVVDIEGTAGSLTHKRLAGALAWWVPGVADVINSVEVAPPEEDNDGELADAVMLVLEKDGLVHPSSISVSVKNWVVTLGGTVTSEAEKNAAEEDAWFVWGVNEVRNLLKIASARR